MFRNLREFSNLAYWPLHFIVFIFKGMTRLPYAWQLKFGRGLGFLFYHLGGRRVATSRVNCQLCFPSLSTEEREQLVKANCYSTGEGIIETALCWLNPSRLLEISTVTGIEYIDQALAQKKPVILLGYHFTTLEIGGSIVAHHRDLGAMYRANENLFIENLMRKGRLHHAKKLFRREDVRQCVKHLKSGGILWYAIDQDTGPKQSVFVPFFNIPTTTATATTKFVKLTGAVVLPLTQKRRQNGSGIDVTVHAPLEGFTGRDETQDCVAINRFIENYLRSDPIDYLWVHRRFKTRPDSQSDLYPKRKRRRSIGEPKWMRLVNQAEVTWPNSTKPKLVRLNDEQLGVIHYTRYPNIPFAWQNPFPAYIKAMETISTDFTIITDYYCVSQKAFLLIIHTEDSNLINSLIEEANAPLI
ncbi:MAG: LpxL/LpxP family Kdo(2)-lipid IV(A) lauroyl/palmitoleoyl acyltransferase [Pseudomonadota bacterium]